MPRTRMIKPECFTSETLAKVSRDSRYTFAGLWTLADDFGVLPDMPKTIAGMLFPHDDDVTTPQMNEWLDALAGIGVIGRVVYNSKHYIVLPGWNEHQKIDHPGKFRHIPEEALTETLARLSRDTRETLAPQKPETRSQKPETTSCPEPANGADSRTEEPILGFPVNGDLKNREWWLTQTRLNTYSEAFPNMDVLAEFRKARLWLENNPTRRKTAKGMPRFLQGWIERSNNRGNAAQKAGQPQRRLTGAPTETPHDELNYEM